MEPLKFHENFTECLPITIKDILALKAYKFPLFWFLRCLQFLSHDAYGQCFFSKKLS